MLMSATRTSNGRRPNRRSAAPADFGRGDLRAFSLQDESNQLTGVGFVVHDERMRADQRRLAAASGALDRCRHGLRLRPKRQANDKCGSLIPAGAVGGDGAAMRLREMS